MATEYQKREIAVALPTGTNAIGKLAANDGVDIGDVDVKSIAAGNNNIGNVDIVTLPSLPTGTNIIGEIKPVDNSGNHQASMDTVARAGFAKITDGTETASVDTNNRLEVSNSPKAYSGRTFKYEDADFVTGDSPVTLDVNSDLSRNARDGYIICDGAGNILIEISDNGTNYGSQHTMKSGEVMSLTGLDIDSIKVTWVTDSAYRILVI